MLAPKTCVNPSRITVESNGNHVIHLLRLYLLRPGFIESLCMLPVLPQTLLRNFKASFIEEKTQCLMDVHNGPWFHFDSRSAIRVQVFDRQVDIGYGLAPSKPASTKKGFAQYKCLHMICDIYKSTCVHICSTWARSYSRNAMICIYYMYNIIYVS